MSKKFELYRVILPGGRKVWVGVLFGFPFVGNNDDKTAILLEQLGFGILVESDHPMTAAEFLYLARGHPVLSLVDDWKQMGLSLEIEQQES